MSKKVRRGISATAFYGLVLILFLFMASPILWIVATSVQPYINLTDIPPRLSWSEMTMKAYAKLLDDGNFIASLRNTVIITSASSLLTLALASFAAFAISFFKFRGKNGILFMMTSLQMAPAIVLLIPLFMLLRSLGLIDTYPGTILVLTLFIMPLAIWMLRSFYQDIPGELLEAARMDGCSRLGTMVRIVLPLGSSGLFATYIFCFITSWNELLIPLTISMTKTTTLTMYASTMGGAYEVNYAGAAAVSVMSSIPTVILALVFRSYLVRGLFEGAVKG